ncbi:S8 family peptidase [Paenibacillus polymyxa]|uniref:S8 family peptidase n=1 Tax=Paenibacillus polymyxa TaxID=1406 RepID=UPI00046EC94F|nr:S8 family peptidase [Paenibacillus polymyxa]
MKIQSIGLPNYNIKTATNKENKGLEIIHAEQFWKRNIFGSNVVIAVLDTGIDMKHEDLQNNIIGGRNFTSDYDNDPHNYQDGNGHGTHVAGIIAANNKKVNIGVAPRASILILKTLTNDGDGDINNLIEAIYYAILWRGPNGESVNIMAMSLGTKKDNPLLHDAIRYAVGHGLSIVAASGNDGNGESDREYRYPGAYNEVIEVGSIGATKLISKFSNKNEQLDIVAPGEDIYSTFLNNKYASFSGTSMAVPFVAGALALIIEEGRILFKRDLTEPEIYAQLIKSSSLLFGNPAIEGNGMLNLLKSFG